MDRYWRAMSCYDPETHKAVPKDAVVLDLDVPAHTLIRTLRGNANGPTTLLSRVANQIEAQTKPRIDEPGWGEKVEAGVKGDTMRHEFVRFSPTRVLRWSDADGATFSWGDLIDPELV